MRNLVFVYARSDSSRLPGKALLPLAGHALLDVVCARARCVAADGWAVLTSARPVDDALAAHALERGMEVVRGDAFDLVRRTLQAIEDTGATHFLRVNGDAPLFEPELADYGRREMGEAKMVTNIVRRRFPYGVSVEWLDAASYRSLADTARPDEREHVTQHFYRQLDRLAAVSLEQDRDDSAWQLTVDTREDHARLSELLKQADILTVPYWSLLGLDRPRLSTRTVA